MATTKFNPWTQTVITKTNNNQTFGGFDRLTEKYSSAAISNIERKHTLDMNRHIDEIQNMEHEHQHRLEIMMTTRDQQYGTLVNSEQVLRNISQLQEATKIVHEVSKAYHKCWINLEAQDQSRIINQPSIEIPYEQRQPLFNQMKALYGRKTPLIEVKDLDGELREAQIRLSKMNSLKLQ